MRRLFQVMIFAMVVSACGDEAAVPSADEQASTTQGTKSGSLSPDIRNSPEAVQTPEVVGDVGIRLLARGGKLPKCNGDIEGVTYYVADDDRFMSCLAAEWKVIDLRGSDGEAGKDGVNGAKGEKGEKGEKGDTGSAGAVGATGSQGVAGVDGVSAHTLKLVSGATTIGDVYSIDKSTNDYWVVSGDMRLEIDRADGTFPYAYLVFSGLGCTGTSRMVITNGYFANVYVKGSTGIVVKATGANLGSFTYASRMPQSTNCQDVSSSVSTSWAYSTPTLGFTYPVVSPEIQN